MKKITTLIIPLIFTLNIGCIYDYDLRTITYSGYVYKKSDSSPLSGIHVDLSSSDDSNDAQTNTDINGHYSLPIDVDCRGGSVRLFFSSFLTSGPPDYVTQYFDYTGSDGGYLGGDACNPPVLEVYLEERP